VKSEKVIQRGNVKGKGC